MRRRLPLATLQGLSLAGLSEQEIERFVIPARTRRHRAEKNQRLTIEESDRAVRILRIQLLAEEMFGEADKANRWLRKELAELGGETPLNVAQTEAGARVIEAVLGNIAWGAAALCGCGGFRACGLLKRPMEVTAYGSAAGGTAWAVS
ncbi:antitoxin Xre/MbcA/ParS toxin-binding domain-containing protein [Pseudaminobacter sp. NGMCC 1.201702]|uniref:antitoxin Xre/MbcA/ParS toxin-binding domain-containing protein n=1 Tax=Pseudaminobacter sp. NGMCC 1.201702 TaxID=3391825 RepID=UPI0039EDF14B